MTSQTHLQAGDWIGVNGKLYRLTADTTHQRGFVWWIYLIAFLSVMAMIYAAYRYVDTHWETSAGIARGSKDKQNEWDQAVQDQREKDRVKVEGATTKHEAQREKTRTVYRTITKNVDRYIDRPVYAAACVDDSGLHDINAALRGPGADSGKPDGRLPGPDAARKPDRGKPAP